MVHAAVIILYNVQLPLAVVLSLGFPGRPYLLMLCSILKPTDASQPTSERFSLLLGLHRLSSSSFIPTKYHKH